MKDPDTIVGSCEEEHPELQTSRWIDFMKNLPSIATRLSFQKENVHDFILRTSNNSNQIRTKSSQNSLNEQQLINAKNSKEEARAPSS